MLKEWSPSFEGFFVYYPGHRQVPTGVRAFIDMIRAARGSMPVRSSLKNSFCQRMSESRDFDRLAQVYKSGGFLRQR